VVFITEHEILETVSMIRSENLDVRAVTMGISLTDCAGRDPRSVAARAHAKIVQRAGRLVGVADEIEHKYGIPIVNKRVSLTPIAHVVGSDHAQDANRPRLRVDLDLRHLRAGDVHRVGLAQPDADLVRGDVGVEVALERVRELRVGPGAGDLGQGDATFGVPASPDVPVTELELADRSS